MARWVIVILAAALAACASQAIKVSCDGRLQPINASAPKDAKGSSASTATASATPVPTRPRS